MKTINVSELKTHLSRYLRMAARGTRIVVTDRNDPIAQLGPLERPADLPWDERLAREGKLVLGTQDWASLKITPLDPPIDATVLKGVLDDIRADVR